MLCPALLLLRDQGQSQTGSRLPLLLRRLIDGTKGHFQILRQADISTTNHGYILGNTQPGCQQTTNCSNSSKVVVAKDRIWMLVQSQQIAHCVMSYLNAGFFEPGAKANNNILGTKSDVIRRQCFFVAIQSSHRCTYQLTPDMRDPLPA